MSAFDPFLPLEENQAVTHCRLVDDQLGMRRVSLQLLAERPDRHAEIFGLVLLGRSPDGAQEMLVAEHPPGMLGQLGEDRKFLGR